MRLTAHCSLLREMHVGEDVVLTVAVVAGALAAVAEGHVRVVGVGLAADAALVVVALLLLLLLDGLLKLHRLAAVAVL